MVNDCREIGEIAERDLPDLFAETEHDATLR
jgi:hypothetical protein